MNEILNILNNKGYEAYIVGGYVRDFILNKSSFDIDICTNASFNEIKKLFPYKVYDNYLSIHFNKDNYNYDITCFRKEYNYINNKPTLVLQCNSLYEDLLRRDFTINAICMDKNNNIIDLIDGKKDIDNKLIKCIGNTYDKFIEDNTRILRAIRFCSILDFNLDDDIKEFLINYGYILSNLNKEFIKKELDIIFKSNSSGFFDIVNRYNLKKYLCINFDNIVNSDYYGLWAQIECDFNFNKKDRYIINSIKYLINKGYIDDNDYLLYDEYICKIANDIISNK